jgi:hypothetical protein
MASGDEAANQFWNNAKKDAEQLYEKVKQHPLISLFFILAVVLIVVVPHWQVSGISNSTVQATQENQDRATLAQILGGVAIAIGLYYTWRRIGIAEEDLKATKEGQITERFTRAIEQLGNPAIEIRLGGIYALERIANESEKDYWPIMKILAAYIREKSPIKEECIEAKGSEQQEKDKPLPTDIQVILELICKRKPSFNEELDLQNSNLRKAQLSEGHLEYADLRGADLRGADLKFAFISSARLNGAILTKADIKSAHLEEAELEKAHLEGAYLEHSILKGVNLTEAHLEGTHLDYSNLGYIEWTINDQVHHHISNTKLRGAFLEGANLEYADLQKADLKGAKNLTVDQLSKAKTLYKAELDEGLEAELRAKGFGHLLDDEPKD